MRQATFEEPDEQEHPSGRKPSFVETSSNSASRLSYQIATILGSLLCIGAGVYLLSFSSPEIDPAAAKLLDIPSGGKSWFEVMAHGIGIYFIAKGLLLGALTLRTIDLTREG